LRLSPEVRSGLYRTLDVSPLFGGFSLLRHPGEVVIANRRLSPR
jgi:hypothetical protein